MKKKIFGGIAVLVIVVAAAWNVSLSSKTNGMSDVMLANVEALATECPDPYDVQDHYITVKIETTTVTSDINGNVSIGKDAVKGGFDKNKNVTIIVSLYNCDGVQNGSCCKQSDVRTVIN